MCLGARWHGNTLPRDPMKRPTRSLTILHRNWSGGSAGSRPSLELVARWRGIMAVSGKTIERKQARPIAGRDQSADPKRSVATAPNPAPASRTGILVGRSRLSLILNAAVAVQSRVSTLHTLPPSLLRPLAELTARRVSAVPTAISGRPRWRPEPRWARDPRAKRQSLAIRSLNLKRNLWLAWIQKADAIPRVAHILEFYTLCDHSSVFSRVFCRFPVVRTYIAMLGRRAAVFPDGLHDHRKFVGCLR
jgi:hypothetical protein